MHLTKRFSKNILWAVIETRKQMKASDLSILAGSLAFSTVISLVPLLAVSLSVFTAFGGMESLLHRIEPFILQNLVDASGAQISKNIRRAIERVHSGALGIGGVIGLLIASTKLFHDMERAVQRVWGIETKRRLWIQIIVYWLVMFIGPLLLAGLLGLIGSKDLNMLRGLPRGAILVAFEFVALVTFYKIVPHINVKLKSALISAFLATIALMVAQSFYATIVKTFLSINKIYGSIASVPIFLVWLLVLWQICLTGVALCAVLDRGGASEKKELYE